MANFDGVLDARQVAKRLGCSVSAVHGLAARGTLPSTWLGGTRLFTAENVNRYLSDSTAQRRRRSKGTTTAGGGRP